MSSSHPDAPSAAPPETPAADRVAESRTYNEPNLVLSDPDRYAFAHRIRRLTFVLAALAVLVAGPYLVGQYRYHLTYNRLKAEVDVATEGLSELKPQLQEFTLASRLVAKNVGPSVVSIRRPDIRGAEGQGSGVIVDKEGYIITNCHVVENAPILNVRLADGRITTASIVGADRQMDLAVLKIDLPNLIPAEWGDSDKLQVGDLVWAVGSPFGLDSTITFGIVSAKQRSNHGGVVIDEEHPSAYQEYIQTDVAINPGNSGGPLVDIDGRVVGINAAILGSSYRGVSFAIPAQLARDNYDRLRKYGFIERGYLGFMPDDMPEGLRRKLALEAHEGVYVGYVLPDGPASSAGIQVGDVILQWNDFQANNAPTLSRKIAATEIGSMAVVRVKRLGKAGEPIDKSLEVEVGRAPYSIVKKRQR